MTTEELFRNKLQGRALEKALEALEFCREAHRAIDQVRKYSGEPYEKHPERVAATLIAVGVRDWKILAAALLHDVLEDVYPHESGKGKPYSLVAICDKFGSQVGLAVYDLTDIYTKEAFPKYNRKERHAQELVRMGFICNVARIVKCADVKDNTEDIAEQDPAYGKIYLAEKRKVIEAILKNAPAHVTLISEMILDENTIMGKSIASQTN